MTWCAMKFHPYTNCALTIVLNSFVHILMYTYYYMASEPKLKRHLWWKKYITITQLIQFLILFVQAVWMMNKPCLNNVHRAFLTLAGVEDVYFIYAFSSFFINNYKSNKKLVE